MIENLAINAARAMTLKDLNWVNIEVAEALNDQASCSSLTLAPLIAFRHQDIAIPSPMAYVTAIVDMLPSTDRHTLGAIRSGHLVADTPFE